MVATTPVPKLQTRIPTNRANAQAIEKRVNYPLVRKPPLTKLPRRICEAKAACLPTECWFG